MIEWILVILLSLMLLGGTIFVIENEIKNPHLQILSKFFGL